MVDEKRLKIVLLRMQNEITYLYMRLHKQDDVEKRYTKLATKDKTQIEEVFSSEVN